MPPKAKMGKLRVTLATIATIVAVSLTGVSLFYSHVDTRKALFWWYKFNWIIVGPMWIVAVFLMVRQVSAAIATSVLAYLIFAFGLIFVQAVVYHVGYAGKEASVCSNNLRRIALGILQYERRYGCLPPAYIADASGKRYQSWRTLILPFVEDDTLHKSYSYADSWDSPINSKIRDTVHPLYTCPESSNELNISMSRLSGRARRGRGQIDGSATSPIEAKRFWLLRSPIPVSVGQNRGI